MSLKKALQNTLKTGQHLGLQFVKFGFVGVASTIIDFAVLIFLTEIFHLDPVISAAISFTISLVFNYWASMRYVFRHRSNLTRRKEFSIFVLLSIIGLSINELLMWLGTVPLNINYIFIKILATIVVLFWNFFSRKKWLDESDGGYELEV